MSAVDLDLTDVGTTPVTDVARPAAVVRPSGPSRLARLGPFVTIALVVLAWEIAGRTEVFGPQSLPAPTAILRQLWNDRSIYPGNIRTTLREAWPGYLWGNLAAIALGIVFVHIPLFER